MSSHWTARRRKRFRSRAERSLQIYYLRKGYITISELFIERCWYSSSGDILKTPLQISWPQGLKIVSAYSRMCYLQNSLICKCTHSWYNKSTKTKRSTCNKQWIYFVKAGKYSHCFHNSTKHKHFLAKEDNAINWAKSVWNVLW